MNGKCQSEAVSSHFHNTSMKGLSAKPDYPSSEPVIYIMTDVSMVGWLPKWIYLFIVDCAVVRIFRCSKPKAGSLLD